MSTLALTIFFNVRYRLLRYAPTNILLIRTHGRHGVRWFLFAVSLAVVYFYAAAICTTLLNHDGPGWLNALVILFTLNGFKMLRIDPVTLVLRRYIRVPQPDRSADADTYGEEVQGPYEVETMGATR
ncbi:MAG: sulfate permease [Austwickia sp.]|nr:MAG: sulfate permease [Austwickia sp.]